MKKIKILFFAFFLIFSGTLKAQSLATITAPLETDFGTYTPNPVNITPNVPVYTINPDLSNVININDFQFTENAKTMLANNGFVIGSNKYKQIHHFYNYAQEKDIPIFVTTDALLHTFHILFDYSLRILEVQKFYDDINNHTDKLIDKTLQYYNTSPDSSLKEILKKNLAFLSVGKKCLESDYSPNSLIDSLVTEELVLIEAHQGFSPSPIFEYDEDYSQYVPRGHYTRNEILECYFKGMMWFGRISFRLHPARFDKLNTIGKQETAQAILLTKAILETSQAEELWNRIYQPTVFFVGKTDDLNIYDFQTAAESAWSKTIQETTLKEIADTAVVASFIIEADKLRDPLINSSFTIEFQEQTKGFRLMGQRFIPDSYIFQNLVFDALQSRYMPMGLDVMAVLGSQRAEYLLRNVYNQMALYPDYEPALNDLKTQFNELESSVWAQNLYWNWLYTLMPLLFQKYSGYPPFMLSSAWADKELYTALALWAELRHDTILYAKQSCSGVGIPSPIPLIKGYVEPNPYIFGRLASLANFMLNGLSNKNLLLSDFQTRLENLEFMCLTLKTIAEKELSNQAISEDEAKYIMNIGPRLENIIAFPPEISGQIENDVDKEMAVIADVHTDPTSMTVLEEGVGYPLTISVIVPIDGYLILTQGAIFSYYEFSQPISERLTDEQWQDILRSDSPKEKPIWTESFIDNTDNYANTGRYEYEGDVKDIINDIQENLVNKPYTFSLFQNYPNPFNPVTTIEYQLPKTSYVELTIYNILGKEITKLVSCKQNPGSYKIFWNGKNKYGILVSNGIYFYQLKAENFFQTKKLIYLK